MKFYEDGDSEVAETVEEKSPSKPTTEISVTKPAVGTDGSTWINSSTGTVYTASSGAWVPTSGMTVSPTVTAPSFTGGVITGGSIPPSWATTPPPIKKPPAIIDGPTRRPKKLLVAFLGDDDEVEWCAKVNPDDIDVSFDKDEPAPRLELGFWLIDAG